MFHEKEFLGLILWMGFVRANPIANYWSRNRFYNFDLPRSTMSRDRFELLLSNFHFADKSPIAEGDGLGKISPLFNKLQEKHQEIFTPGENIVIDETLISWRERLVYISNKAHKYGIKLFKPCSLEGCTWSMRIYCGKSSNGIGETECMPATCT